MNCWMTKNGHQIIQVLGGRANAFMVCHEGSQLLIDTGRKTRRAALNRRLIQFGAGRDSLKALILTHTHFDHAENASQVKENYKTNIVVQRYETENIRRGVSPGIKGTNSLSKAIVQGLGEKIIPGLNYTPVEPDKVVDEAFDLACFGFVGSILHTSGHTAGSMSIVLDDEIALVGDVMFGIFPNSVFPPFAEDPQEMILSWGKLLKTKCRLFLPTHGSAISRTLLEKEYKRNMQRFKKKGTRRF